MRKIAPLFLLCLIFAACGDDSSSEQSPPPPEMIGAWGEAISQSSSSGSVQDVCSDFTVGSGTVSSNLFKIDEFGNVFDGKQMSNGNNPYRIIGTVDSTGLLSPNADGRKEFLGGFADISGVVMNPIIHAKYSIDPIKGQMLTLDVELQVVSGGQTVTQPFDTREYYKMTEAMEKIILTKAQQCLAKSKP